MDGKKRVIIDYSKLTDDLLRYLVEKYPDGYDDRDVLSLKNAKNETIEASKVETDETIYLVKISTKLEQTMEVFTHDDDVEMVEMTMLVLDCDVLSLSSRTT